MVLLPQALQHPQLKLNQLLVCVAGRRCPLQWIASQFACEADEGQWQQQRELSVPLSLALRQQQ